MNPRARRALSLVGAIGACVAGACSTNRYVTVPEQTDASAASVPSVGERLGANDAFDAAAQAERSVDRADAGADDLSRHGRLQLLPLEPDAASPPASSPAAPRHPDVRVTWRGSLPGADGGAPTSNVDRVLAGGRPKLRACYAKGLNLDPTQQGTLEIEARLAANGEVARATSTKRAGIGPEVAACCVRVIQNLNFDPPGSPATIPVLLDLVP